MKKSIEITIKVLKAVLYLASIILPAIDALKGIKNGVRLGMMDSAQRAAEKHYQEVKSRMNREINDELS